MAKRINPIDQLAEIRAHIKHLKKEEKTLSDKCIDKYGIGSHEAVKANATIFESERNSTDWKSLCVKLKATARQIASHTSTKITTTVRTLPKLAK